MKILFVTTGLGVGGAEKQVVDLADHLYSRGYEVKIAYLTGPALLRPKSEEIEIVGFKVIKNFLSLVHGYFRVRKFIKNFSPDVVHSHMVHANIFTRMLRLTCGMSKLVCTAHNTNEGGRLWMWLYRITAFLADATTNVSEEAVAAFEMKGAAALGTMIAMPNGINTEHFKPSRDSYLRIRKREDVAEDEKIIIAVGRLTAAKDYPNLFRAYLEVLRDKQNCRLWVIGDGNLREDLMLEVGRLGMAKKIFFLGIQSNVNEWINAADLFVLPSAWEGFGLVVAEAMACEKLVVATDSGGVKEVMGECGYLVPKRDSKSLALAMLNALDLPVGEAQNLGKKARQRVLENYSLDSVANRWVKVYTSPIV